MKNPTACVAGLFVVFLLGCSGSMVALFAFPEHCSFPLSRCVKMVSQAFAPSLGLLFLAVLATRGKRAPFTREERSRSRLTLFVGGSYWLVLAILMAHFATGRIDAGAWRWRLTHATVLLGIPTLIVILYYLVSVYRSERQLR